MFSWLKPKPKYRILLMMDETFVVQELFLSIAGSTYTHARFDTLGKAEAYVASRTVKKEIK